MNKNGYKWVEMDQNSQNSSNDQNSRVDMEVGELSLPDDRKDSSNISNSDGSDRTILSNHTFCSMMTKKPLFSSQL